MRGKNTKFPKNIIGKKTQREDISSGLLVNFHDQCKAGHSLRYLDAHLVNPSNFSKNKYSSILEKNIVLESDTVSKV